MIPTRNFVHFQNFTTQILKKGRFNKIPVVGIDSELFKLRC